jgi:hypothetical protein
MLFSPSKLSAVDGDEDDDDEDKGDDAQPARASPAANVTTASDAAPSGCDRLPAIFIVLCEFRW